MKKETLWRLYNYDDLNKIKYYIKVLEEQKVLVREL